MQAIVKAGPVRIGISTGGVAPRVAKAIKEALQRLLDAKFARFVDCLATQRRRNRMRLPDAQERRAAMIAAAEGFAVEAQATYPRWFEDSLPALGPRRLED
jgi:precorrin-2 dehydrogenase/sirohydrochlorin ferrochelatase